MYRQDRTRHDASVVARQKTTTGLGTDSTEHLLDDGRTLTAHHRSFCSLDRTTTMAVPTTYLGTTGTTSSMPCHTLLVTHS